MPPERYEHLDGYELAGCAVRRRNLISFWGQRWDDPDPLETRVTRVFFFNSDKPPESRWGYREPAETRGFRGCAVTIPEERWLFVADDGEVYVVGGGTDGFEAPISSAPFTFSNVKSVAGKAVAVGPRRTVFVRDSVDAWRQLAGGLSPGESSGFSDVAGFDEDDLYACGGRGDLWHFDGSAWVQLAVPTDAPLSRVCCASDGNVYVLTGDRKILFGRDAAWSILDAGGASETLESIVEYAGKVIVSTQSALFEVDAGTFRPARLGDMPSMRSRSFLASGAGILVVAGSKSACSFDGTTWSVVIA